MSDALQCLFQVINGLVISEEFLRLLSCQELITQRLGPILPHEGVVRNERHVAFGIAATSETAGFKVLGDFR